MWVPDEPTQALRERTDSCTVPAAGVVGEAMVAFVLADAYRRKTITFQNEFDRVAGMDVVKVNAIGLDPAEFEVEQDPGNPAADEKGMVKMPNVNMISEMSDMREANRSYEADLQVIKQSRDLISMTIDLLKGSS